MNSVREHYDGVLSPYYSRLLGNFDAKVAEQQALLERLAVKASRPGALAVDLGCGSGVHSIALAGLGFRVLAVDFCPPLLAELRERAAGLPVEAVPGDIRDVETLVRRDAEVVVCMVTRSPTSSRRRIFLACLPAWPRALWPEAASC